MSEYIFMSIEIGGTLTPLAGKELINAINDELSDIEGPTKLSELTKIISKNKQTVKWFGRSDYGECDEIKAVCTEHNLSYIHHCEATTEYDASIKFWTPDMKEEGYCNASQNADAMVSIKQIKPYIDVLVAMVKANGDTSIIPSFIGIDEVADIVEIGLKDQKKFIPALQKKISEMLVTEPDLPPLLMKD